MQIDQKRKIVEVVRKHGPEAQERAARAGVAYVRRPQPPEADAFYPGPMGIAFSRTAPPTGDWRNALRERYREQIALSKNPFYNPAQGRAAASDLMRASAVHTTGSLLFVDEALRPAANLVAAEAGDLVSEAIGAKDGRGEWPYAEAMLGRRVYPSAITVDVSSAFQDLARFRAGEAFRRDLLAESGVPARKLADYTLAVAMSDMLHDLGLVLVDLEVERRGGAFAAQVVTRDLPMLALALRLDPGLASPEKGMHAIDDIGMERLELEERSARLGQRMHYET